MSIPADISHFIDRWRDKETGYDCGILDQCFDAFFSAYVLHNFLYNHIYQQNCADKEDPGDQAKATVIPWAYLGAATIAQDTAIQTGASAIKDLIEKQTFYVRDATWDKEQIAGMNSPDPDQWSKGVLAVVYRIRCNTFHGGKAFEENQKAILIPCISIIRRLNEMMIEKLRLPGESEKVALVFPTKTSRKRRYASERAKNRVYCGDRRNG